MIVCSSCGLQNDDSDAFCGGCGAFLEWEGEAVAPEPEPEPEPADDDPSPERAGLIERVVDRFQGGDDGAEVADSAAEGSADTVEQDGRRGEVADGAASPPGQSAAPPGSSAGPPGHPPAPPSIDAAAPSDVDVDPGLAAAQRAEREAEAAEEAHRVAEERAQREADAAGEARQRVAAAEQEQRRLEQLAQEPDDQDGVDRSDPERVAAKARAEVEAEEVRRATEEAETAERGKREAEAAAQREAEAAERARRAASLVARPKPVSPPTGGSGPGATPPGAVPRRRRGGGAARDAAAGAEATAEQPGPVAPKAVPPGKARRRPTPKQQRAERRRLRPGDVICGQCGEGNDQERRFCRRCGNSLVDAEPAKKARWWHRLRRKPKVHEAGARPMRGGGGMKDRARGGAKAARSAKRGAMKVTRVLALLALVAGAVGVTVGPWREPAMEWATDRFDSVRQLVAPRFEPLSALSAEASSELEGHPAQRAVDLLSTTWWAAGDTTDDGVGQRLFIDFGSPADIGAIVVTPGAADTAEYVAQPRPRRLHLVFDTGETRTLDIEDSPDPQSFRIDAVEGASNVEVQIDQVWLGQSGSHVSLTQIEFQTRG